MDEKKEKFKIVEGVQIYIIEGSGRFTANIGGKWVTRSQLSKLEKEIAASLDTVEAYTLQYGYPQTPKRCEVVRYEGGRARHKDGYLARFAETHYIVDGPALEKLQELARQYHDLCQRWQKTVYDLPQLNPRNIESYRQQKKG